jgi:rhodanese-related sulfurtransferase
MSTVFRLAANRNSCKILRNALAKRSFHISLPQHLVAVQCCSAAPTGFNQKRYFTGLSVRSFCQQEKERWADLSYEQLNALLESRDIILIDVREPKEIEALGKISDSINIPLSQIKAALQLADGEFSERFKCEKPQKHATNLVFYGLCEVKSSAALEIAHKLGYKKARHFPGGFEEWAKRQKDSQKKASSVL